jgi:membrane dipeptidase
MAPKARCALARRPERRICRGPDRIAGILGLEGADPLEGRAERFRHFFELEVRDPILAWKDNPSGGTGFGEDTPLTREGERLLGLAEELAVMIDASHGSDRAFEDVCRRTTGRFIASTSNCRSLCPNSRKLTDAMIRRLADRGGVMGINTGPHFLDPEYHKRSMTVFKAAQKPNPSEEERGRTRKEALSIPRPALEWVGRHVAHAIDVGGEDSVRLGGDTDGSLRLPEAIHTMADCPALLAALQEVRLSDHRIDKVCSRDVRRVFEAVLS